MRRDREWVCAHPSPTVRLDWLFDPERQEFALQRALAVAMEGEKAARLLGSIIKEAMTAGTAIGPQNDQRNAAAAGGDHPERTGL
jgi:hypothetical protein